MITSSADFYYFAPKPGIYQITRHVHGATHHRERKIQPYYSCLHPAVIDYLSRDRCADSPFSFGTRIPVSNTMPKL